MKSPEYVAPDEYFYVPSAIRRHGPYRGQVIPILYPLHEDGPEDCLNPTPPHYHVDKRFIEGENTNNADAWTAADLQDFKMRRMKCLQRESKANELYPFSIERLYRNHQNQKLKNRICPHRGVQITNACGTCPAHGLTWDLETNELKFQLPFFLSLQEFPSPYGIGEIKDGQCTIIVLKSFSATNLTWYLSDAKEQLFAKCKFTTNVGTEFEKGCSIQLEDKYCFKK